ncbi:MAG TPA: carboxypeptidase regulatory-like domain-containing protein [Nocardioides sp.]|nr:carboxypeptidase regulatory-like domain-containing protein [Nocardioides sp.]
MNLRAFLVRLLAIVVAFGGVFVGWSGTPAHAADGDPVHVTGTVVDADGGAAIAEASVYASSEADYVEGVTDAEGGFALDLVPGTYWLGADADGYDSAGTEVEVTAQTTTLPTLELTRLPDPITVTGTVVDADTDDPIADAWVSSDEGEAQTDVDGSYTLAVQPGAQSFYASAQGYEGNSVDYEVAEGSTAVPPIALTPLTPGIYVSVRNETFGDPAAGAQVVLDPAVGDSTTQTTDEEGNATFTDLAEGTYTVSVLPDEANELVPSGDPVEVDYAGGVDYVDLGLELNLKCQPASANAGLTNMGFENGLDGWTLAHQTETIEAVGGDTFTTPWEGAKMARLGSSQPSSEETQPPGPNVMCQDFTVTKAQESFAFNVFTYDYTGFDEFQFDVVVSDPDTGETLAAYRQGAWGDSGNTDLKTSGWRGVKLDLADHVGEKVRLSFRAGGTSDDLFAFWAYLDSAATLPPSIATSDAVVESETGSVTNDPSTGQITVAMPQGAKSDLSLTLPGTCQAEGVEPTAVSLILNGQVYPGTKSGSSWKATIPAEELVSGPLNVQTACEGETTLVEPIGEVVLYDPSGIVSDATTGAPVVGAQVKLWKVPTWSPKTTPGAPGAGECETNQSKTEGAPWSQAAPTNLGELVNAASPEISPNVNPFITNNEGYYGWDVAEGCWYVTVTKAGYQPLTSPVVGVPTAVTDLNLKLTPKPTGPTAGCIAAKKGLATAQAALAKAQLKVKGAAKGLKKAKKSHKAAKVKKAKKKLSKAKKAVKTAQTGLTNAQANVGKHCV